MRAAISERRLVFLIGVGQFVNTVDFTMVLPLGPDFAKALDIPVSNLGVLGGSYTATQAVTSFAAAFFLDRFDRRRALVVAFTGLVVATSACGFATGFVSLLVARMIAGVFGGTAETLAFAIVGDAIAPERMGRAMGAIASAIAAASVLGVPAGLELARLGGWRAPFFTLAALAAVVTVASAAILPPQRAHLLMHAGPLRAMLRRPMVLLGLACVAIGVMAHYTLLPNLSAYFQFNRSYPRDQLGLLYMLGGAFAFATARLVGWLADRHGAAVVIGFGTALYAAVLTVGFIYPVDAISVRMIFIGFMISSGFRFVPMMGLSALILGPEQRARFLSLEAAVDSVAVTIGAILGAQLLSEHADGSLTGIADVAWLAIAMTFVYAALCYAIQRGVRARIARTAGPMGGLTKIQPGVE
jgi:predicted MFS family arabinose efflux permease